MLSSEGNFIDQSTCYLHIADALILLNIRERDEHENNAPVIRIDVSDGPNLGIALLTNE